MPSKESLYHSEVRKFHSATFYRFSTGDFISHMLEERSRSKGGIGKDRNFPGGRSCGL